MELYNFFTEVTYDKEKIEEMKYCLEDLNKLQANCAQLVEHKTKTKSNKSEETNKIEYSIIGQLHGEDTNIGDTDLLVIFNGLNWTWFDARMPSIQMSFNKGKRIK